MNFMASYELAKGRENALEMMGERIYILTMILLN